MNIGRPEKRAIIYRVIAMAALGIVICLLLLFANYPHVVERYYSEDIYVVICRVLHPVFNLLPFSVGDILYIAVVGYLIYATTRLIGLLLTKQFRQSGFFFMGLIMRWEIVIVVFYLFWGMNYYRPSAGERLNLRDASYTTQHLQVVTAMLIDSANSCRQRITAADSAQKNEAIFKTAISAVIQLSNVSADFSTYSPNIKPSILSPLMNYLGTSGYYNPFTTEAQLNYQMPYFERPVVACHEMSHQMGYGLEDEADFVGFLAGVGSKDRLLRYSAYQLGVEQCMRALRYRDTAANNQMKKFISPLVRHDFIAQRLYWAKYRGAVGAISSFFYDGYLKANNQPHGLETYNQMVLLLMAWYR